MTAFLALLRRDFHILLRNLAITVFADQSQSIMWAVVFGIFFPRLHMVSDEFVLIIFPGLISVTVLMSGINGVLLPLFGDLLRHREINERLLAPISVTEVALEKISAGTINGVVSGLVSLPVMLILVARWRDLHPNWPALLGMMLLGSIVSAGFGLTIGAMAGARFSGYLFDVVIGPMIFFGCTYYAWEPLRAIGPLRYFMLVNPLVFISEGLRFALTPTVPHMAMALLLPGLMFFAILFTLLGARKFEQRTIL